MKIPTRTTQFKLRTDIILVSEAKKQLIFQELTVPWKERMEKAQERKREKYQELVEECWRSWLEYQRRGAVWDSPASP